MKKCLVSGSFDPITCGHMDLILQASEIFDIVYVVMLDNTEKSYCFTKQQRLDMLSKAVSHIAKVDYYGGYTVDYCRDNDIRYIIRGIRDVASYAYEHMIDEVNRSINPDIKTIYFPANANHKDISSTMIREKLSKGEDISEYVPKSIVEMIGEYYGER